MLISTKKVIVLEHEEKAVLKQAIEIIINLSDALLEDQFDGIDFSIVCEALEDIIYCEEFTKEEHE